MDNTEEIISAAFNEQAESHAAELSDARKLARYQSIFEQINLGFFEQDLSALRARLARLREDGVTDIRTYASERPGFADECLDLIRTVDVNDACVRLMGAASKKDLIGPTRFRPPNAYRLNAIEALFEGRPIITGKTDLEGVDGRELIVLFTAIVDWEDKEDRDRVIFSVLDITEQERTNERLLATQEALAKANRAATIGALSASIAHELNQPLGAMVMDAQTSERWLRLDPPDLDQAAQGIKRVVANARRAAGIVQAVRDKVVHGQARSEPLDLLRLVNETIQLLERELSLHHAKVHVFCEDEIPSVDADAVELQQVIVNLITNGLQAMAGGPRTGRAELEVRIDLLDEETVRVSVRDEGPGISEDMKLRLFDTFFTTKPEGMGMGLAICRSTIESYGGKIVAFNHHDGGAVMEFTLPAALEPSTAIPCRGCR
ncbi:sensor histidine kinase [Rhizobium sullae]|uniref:sensor histidine kinase n=1 Tax=Rhizobium sullae TaxID=50338 RepID=UPI0012FD7C30|nr:ATP-binding protein [Rhizobium sullae]